MRVLLVVLVVVLLVLAAAGLLRGWRNRARRQQSELALPHPASAPADPGAELAPALTGLYVSTTRSGRWQERIVTAGLGRRARATVRLYASGVLVDRQGESEIFLPAADLLAIGTAPGIAGKVMGLPDGILLLTWRLATVALDTGIRVDDLYAQQEWIAAAAPLLPGPGPATSPDPVDHAENTGVSRKHAVDPPGLSGFSA